MKRQIEPGAVVRVKSLSWYYANEKDGFVDMPTGILFTPDMRPFLDKDVKIVQKLGADMFKIEGSEFYWTSDMFDFERVGEFILLSKDGKTMMGHVFPTYDKAKEFLGLRTDYDIRELTPNK